VFDKLEDVVKRFERLEEKLADPTIYDRQEEFKKVNEERGQLEDIVIAYKEYKRVKNNLAEAKEILETESDEEMREMAKEEISEYEKEMPGMEDNLKILLLPKDPLDNKNCMVEIRAGAGGDEASIFVGDVWRMYRAYWETLGFKSDIVSASENDKGYKEVILSVTGDKVYSKMKYESGVHRVQRVPETESQGRVHTSTITVAIMPEADEVEFNLDMNDVRIDVYRSGGKGGQSVNTTDSAVRVTHLPTSTVVAIQDEKSQLKNKEKALKILKTEFLIEWYKRPMTKKLLKDRGLLGKGIVQRGLELITFLKGVLPTIVLA
jgi:peptide chain release factor 1